MIERGFVEAYLLHGSTDRPASYVIETLKAHREAIDFLFAFINNNRSLSSGFIKEIHALITSAQEAVEGLDQFGNRVCIRLEKGTWKKLPNNPTRSEGSIHEYCPPEHVESEIDNLLRWHESHLDNNVPPEIEAAWLHHRFTQIHPFQDGNGRVARALASLVLIKSSLFPLIIPRDNKTTYIEALEAADAGDLAPLVSLFERIQQSEIKKAMSLIVDVEIENEQEQLIESIRQKILTRRKISTDSIFQDAAHVANSLLDVTSDTISALSNRINDDFATNGIHDEYRAHFTRSVVENRHKFEQQTGEIARQAEYHADMRTFSEWCRLTIFNNTQFNIIFSFHCLGYNFSGAMCISAFSFEQSSELENTITRLQSITDDVFIFTHRDDFHALHNRHAQWLDKALTSALAQFKETI